MSRLSLCSLIPLLLVACPQDEAILTGNDTGDDTAGATTTGPAPTTGAVTTTGATEATTGTTAGESTEVTTGPPAPAVCGNGFVEEPEPCDDANDDPDDGCNKVCERTGIPIWTQSWDGGFKKEDFANAVVLDADGNIYVAGTVGGADSNSDAVVRKLDKDGKELEQYVFAGQLGLNDGARGVGLDDDGNVYAAGWETIVDDGPQQAIVRKWEANGDIAWTFTQLPDFVDGSSGIQGMAVRGDKIYVAGNEEVMDKEYVTYLHRLDPADGSSMWRVDITDVNGFNTQGVAVAANGDMLLASALPGGDDSAVPMIARYAASDGAEVWNESYGNGRNGYARAVAVNADGDIAIAGFMRSGLGDWDIWAARYDEDGKVVWSFEFDRGKNDDFANAVAWGPAGDIYVGGFVYEDGQQSNAFVRRYTGDGETYWTSYHNDEIDLYDAVVGIVVDDAAVIVVGNENVLGMQSNQWVRAYEP